MEEGATGESTSTRNFPNRLGKNTNVYLGSANWPGVCSKLGRIPTQAEYLADIGVINANGDKIYKYMNFDQISEYKDVADKVAADPACDRANWGPAVQAAGLFMSWIIARCTSSSRFPFRCRPCCC